MLIPTDRLGKFGGSAVAEDERATAARLLIGHLRHPREPLRRVASEEVRAYLLPRNSTSGISVRFGKATIELRREFGCHRKCLIGRILCNRIPQIADELKAVGNRQAANLLPPTS